MTPARLKVLKAFYKYEKNGGTLMPTIRFVADKCGICQSTAQGHINILLRDGYLYKIKKGVFARNYHITLGKGLNALLPKKYRESIR